MTKLNDFLAGRTIFEEINSPINGKLQVVRELAWGVHITANGLTQSGGIAETIWNTVIREIAGRKHKVAKALIVGVGGGSIAKLVRKYFPESEIIGVDIDPIIVDLGMRYLGLDKANAHITIQDGLEFCEQEVKKGGQYDLICVDVYQGDEYPIKFASKKFLEIAKKLLTDNGIAVFNRLYYGEKKIEAENFKPKLADVFSNIEVIRPEANIMYICKV